MTKIEKAQAQLDSHFMTTKTITTVDLKDQLVKNYPEDDWTIQWVSMFLQNQDLNYVQDSSRRFRIYEAPLVLTSKVLNECVLELEALNKPITKNNVKRILINLDYPLGRFKELFNELNLQHVKGNYTADNHKIYTRVEPGKHLSQSKGKIVDIATMPKKYLRNAIVRYVADNGFDMYQTLNDSNRELYKLLKAYFTHDIREQINNI